MWRCMATTRTRREGDMRKSANKGEGQNGVRVSREFQETYQTVQRDTFADMR